MIIQVARELLGKILVRKASEEILKGKVVETEVCYSTNDPVSHFRMHPSKGFFTKNSGDIMHIRILIG